MSLTNAAENAILALFFNGTTYTGIAQNAGSPLTEFFLSAHTSDPGEGGNQTSNETSYTSYARVATDRNGTDWPVTGNVANLGATESFPQATGGTATLTHFGIGSASSSTGNLFMRGTITPNIAVATGVTPQLTTATSVTLD
jgi:hypothetical protein